LNKIKKLSNQINSIINKIDPDLSTKDFGEVISIIFNEEYGTHNKKTFLETLRKKIK